MINTKVIICFMVITLLIFVVNGDLKAEESEEVPVDWTGPTVFGQLIPDDAIEVDYKEGGSSQENFAQVKLIFKNLPEDKEGEEFTIVGGGINNSGFHGPNATAFEGIGIHFAIPEDELGSNPPRDENYKKDFTREVIDNKLEFEFYYFPSDINTWGERYFPGTEVALTIYYKGSNERIMHADNNQYNWAIAGVGSGNSATIIIDLEEMEEFESFEEEND